MKVPSDTTCDNVSNLGEYTLKIFQNSVDHVNVRDYNDGIVDVNRDHKICDVDDRDKTYLGKVRASDGSCWHHVHGAEYDVFDFTTADASLYTVSGNTVTINGGMDVFYASIETLPVVGRFGDHLDLDDDDLPAPLTDQAVQDAYRTLEYNPGNVPTLMCGSPDEVASDPFHGDNGFDVITPLHSGLRALSIHELSGQKHTVWTELALNAADELRMKMAWSLSQIVSVGLEDVKMSEDFEDTEAYLAFYDLFVKNAFGR